MPAPGITPVKDDRLIYLVDDEELLLELAEVSLLADGYALKKFQNPQAAFESFTREPNKPSLLLTDYAMDSMTGMELSAKCKSAHPPLKILMVSGTEGPEIVNQAPGTVDKFMPKPYKPAELASTVRSLLAAS
jgi:DNA-binding NtrC family response regulator